MIYIKSPLEMFYIFPIFVEKKNLLDKLGVTVTNSIIFTAIALMLNCAIVCEIIRPTYSGVITIKQKTDDYSYSYYISYYVKKFIEWLEKKENHIPSNILRRFFIGIFKIYHYHIYLKGWVYWINVEYERWKKKKPEICSIVSKIVSTIQEKSYPTYQKINQWKKNKEYLLTIMGRGEKVLVWSQKYVAIVYKLSIEIVDNLVKENLILGNKKTLQTYTSYIATLFTAILMMNVLGMVPYSYTPTSSLATTLVLAVATFIGINLIGIKIHKLGLLQLFIPPGCPNSILPLIIMIEIISYLTKPISMAIRLFANMMAGHTLLKILTGFNLVFFNKGGPWLIIGLIMLMLLTTIILLELMVAFLQTYVFCILTCVYVRDAAEIH